MRVKVQLGLLASTRCFCIAVLGVGATVAGQVHAQQQSSVPINVGTSGQQAGQVSATGRVRP